MTLGEDSGMKIQATLWGNLAHLLDLHPGQILAIKNARISEYNGKTLNCGDDHSAIYVDPNHQRTLQLQSYY